MNKLAYIALTALLAYSVSSCYFPGYRLKPGDKIGQMELTTSFEKNIHELCDFTILSLGTCEIPPQESAIGVSTGWAEDTLEALDSVWSGSSWEVTIDDHKVDLPSFGTFDLDVEGQKARVWDIGLSNLAQGKHVVQYDFHFENGLRVGNHTQLFIFTVLAAEPPASP